MTWPNQHAIAVPGDQATIRTVRMETLLDVYPGPSMELREAASEVERLAITGRTGWEAGAESAVLRVKERPEDLAPPNSYDVRLVATKTELPKEIIDLIDPTGWLTPSIDQVTVIGHGALDDPLERKTIEEGRLALRAATIREAGFEWGEMRLAFSGAFRVDDDGYPDGEIEVEAREWRQMIRLAVTSGLIGRDTAGTIESAVELIISLTGNSEDLRAPLRLSGGKVRIGPVPIANAPRLAPPRY